MDTAAGSALPLERPCSLLQTQRNPGPDAMKWRRLETAVRKVSCWRGSRRGG